MIETKKQAKIKTSKKTLKFPAGFLWGAATSAYQVEGGITQNDWAASKMPPAGLACDHYNRYQEDFLLAKKLNHSAHRFSLEWSRIEPVADQWDEDAIEHYSHTLDFLKRQGFKTFVTLHHFTNPLWVASEGGWANRKTIEHFAGFVSKICQTIGHLIDFWVTINEPGIYAFVGYQEGFWPPFKKSLLKSYKVYQNMLKAHNKAYEIIHAYYPEAKVGFAHNISYFEPNNPASFFDRLVVRFHEWFYMDLPYTRTKNDYIGLNHYFYKRMGMNIFSLKKEVVRERKVELSDKGWAIYPRAIFEVLRKLKKFRKPIYITEHGIADRTDKKRPKFIVDYLKEVHRAIQKGVDVRGYLHWALLDSYEWPVLPQEKTGYEIKFGLVEVDFASPDLKRKIRKSARVYARICKSNAIGLSLLL
ncbi:MAG: glycoside hydrolase family 1 protein [Candidatus Doudnabacteria bacterium]|nr:glycoside hydrolase family 1 protein [Candidatus Doudnabacteria bacterium]